MKNKLIATGLAAILMIVLLFAFAMPAVSPDANAGVNAGIMAETADLAVVDSGTVSIIDNASQAPAALAGYIWYGLVLGATLLATVFRRKLTMLLHLYVASSLWRNHSTDESTEMGGGPNKFILPMAA